ncbi:MAG: U32 family peptidase [Thermoguttaceae bacterium]
MPLNPPKAAPLLLTPELMAPAGDWDCARAGVANGADAVYFGLQGGLNARGRAVNFAPDELADLMAFLHTAGVKGYVTFNTLVFGDELQEAERLARLAIAAGVDAILVQDLGLLRLIAKLCPEMPLHASTQMTLSSAECIAEAAALGIRRVVLPRELSIEQIAAVHRQTDIELEAFVHGALCLSYSGQCLASLAFGRRSGNRGQCAQPCRLPYDVICDGKPLDLGPMRYPISPHDLAAHDRLPELIAAGVSAIKIEGRLKPAEYVAAVTRHYRAAIDAVCLSQESRDTASDAGEAPSAADLEMAFSRGFCHGWLDGPQPHALVSGVSSAKRGMPLGQVAALRGDRVAVQLSAAVQRGDGVVFEGDRAEGTEVGGRVYEIFSDGRSIKQAAAGDLVELSFRHGTIESGNHWAGQPLFKTDDPRAARRFRQSFAEGLPLRRVPIDVTVEATVGSVLRVTARSATGVVGSLESPDALAEAVKHPLNQQTLVEQFGRLGNTPYKLRRLEAKLDGRAMAPLSVLGLLRRQMVSALQAAAAHAPQRAVLEASVLPSLRADAPGAAREVPASERCHVHVLCRSMEQLEAALRCGVSSVTADFADPRRCEDAVCAARAGRTPIFLATPRIHKPGTCPSALPLGEKPEMRTAEVFQTLANHQPDGLLVRNLAGLAFCRRTGMPAVADFSLNAANDLTVRWLHERGARRVTVSFDLGPRRCLELAATTPPEWLEAVVYSHMPLFHSEHCLFCRTLSRGNHRANCGRPCERHALRLRDRLGVQHAVLADSECRNTIFHAEAANLDDAMPSLRKLGVRHFRIELTTERTAEEILSVVAARRRAMNASVHGVDE